MRQIMIVQIDIPFGDSPDDGVRHPIYVKEEDSAVIAAYARSFGLAVEIKHAVGYVTLDEARVYLDRQLTPAAKVLAQRQYEERVNG